MQNKVKMHETKFVAFECTGCGCLARDPEGDLQKRQEAGYHSCCPERNMQPVVMYRAISPDDAVPEIPFEGAAIWTVALREAALIVRDSSEQTGAIEAIEALVIADYNPKFADGEIMDLWLGLNGRIERESVKHAESLGREPITTASINVNQFWIFAANLITLAAMRVAAEYTKPEDNWADPMETKDAD